MHHSCRNRSRRSNLNLRQCGSALASDSEPSVYFIRGRGSVIRAQMCDISPTAAELSAPLGLCLLDSVAPSPRPKGASFRKGALLASGNMRPQSGMTVAEKLNRFCRCRRWLWVFSEPTAPNLPSCHQSAARRALCQRAGGDCVFEAIF
jgi:hypothetical protein